MNLLRMMCVSALMMGCGQNHPTDEVATGIYDLTVRADSEACSPVRAVGAMGPVAVIVRGTDIDAPVPEVEASSALTTPRVVLPASAFHAQTNRRIGDCSAGWVHEEWTLLESSRQAFELEHLQQWHGLDACEGAIEQMPGAPSADCTSERRLRYELRYVCADPCRLFLDASGALTCSC